MRRRAPAAAIGLLLALLLSAPALAEERPQTGAPADWPLPVEDSQIFAFFLADRLEYRLQGGNDTYLWDTEGWIGGDYERFWAKAEGEGTAHGGVRRAEFQALYSRLVSPFFDFQVGVRQDVRPHPSRTHAVIGLEGLAPHWFELDSALFVSTKGDVTARIEAEYDILLTQRLVIQPRAELNLALRDVRELDIGAGVSTAELGLRLRYEITREFAPYIGVSWERALGNTADFVRAAGDDPSVVSFVAGLRMWF